MMSRSRRAPSNPPRRTSRVFFFCEYQIEHEQHRVIVCDGMRGIFSRVGVASTALSSSSSFTSSAGGGSSATMMMTKGGGKGGSYGADAEHFSYPLNSDRRTYQGKSNEVYFNGQKYEKSQWRNGSGRHRVRAPREDELGDDAPEGASDDVARV